MKLEIEKKEIQNWKMNWLANPEDSKTDPSKSKSSSQRLPSQF
jgi:hypothetical protein